VECDSFNSPHKNEKYFYEIKFFTSFSHLTILLLLGLSCKRVFCNYVVKHTKSTNLQYAPRDLFTQKVTFYPTGTFVFRRVIRINIDYFLKTQAMSSETQCVLCELRNTFLNVTKLFKLFPHI
jgi:hypothetical protein